MPKFSEEDILQEIERQERKKLISSSSDIDKIVQSTIDEDKDEETIVDIIDYVRAEWGLNENPYPIQRFILKVIFGIPLDDRPDDLVASVEDSRSIKCFRPDQFRRVKYVDIGKNKAVKVEGVSRHKKLLLLAEDPEFLVLPGDEITGRIEVWDKFRENVLGTYNEREFFDFLYGDGIGSENCRISISREEYERNPGRQMNLVVLRLGRRATKTSMAQFIAAYFCYKILKKYHPQDYYQTRRDQPITITLIATTKTQAQDLLAPARATIKRSPYLRRFVEHDDVRRIDLNTPYNIDHGLDSESGIKVKADPCSARATRGPAIMLGLLEEFGLFMSHIKDSNSSDKEIYTAIAPGITDLKNPITDEPEGMMIIVSTPLTTESYMHEVESSIWEGNTELSNSLAIHIPSTWVNPLLSSKSLRSLHAVDSAAYEQEIEAKYSDQYRKAFIRDLVEVCRHDPGDHGWLNPGEDTFMGFDLGGLKQGNDRTCISIIAMNGQGLARLVFHEKIGFGLDGYEDYLDDESEEGNSLCIKKIAKRVDDLWVHWSVRKGLGDSWNCMPPYVMVTTPVGHKPIGEIEKGDIVLNKDGDWVSVEEKFSRGYVGDIIKIKIEGHPDLLELTPEHQVQVWDRVIGGWEWKEAGDLSITDRLKSIPPKGEIGHTLNDGSYGRRIKKIERVPYSGEVQDIKVSKGSSFTAETVVVHNCFGIQSHLKSTARTNLELAHITAAFNDQVARNFIAYFEQRQIIVYADFMEWKIEDSLIREICRLDRKETGGTVKKIALKAPEGSHDDQYSSTSRALFIAQREVSSRPPSTGGTRQNKSMISARERAEILRQQREVAVRTNRGRLPNIRGTGYRR